MSEAVNEAPVTRWQVYLVGGTILTTMTYASFIFALQTQINDKAPASDVAAIRNEVRDIRDLLCDTSENASRRQCKRPEGYYREHD